MDIKVGDRIRFTKTLEDGPTGDRPACVYANRGEYGKVVKVGGSVEGYWVKADAWPHSFGASESEFEVIDDS